MSKRNPANSTRTPNSLHQRSQDIDEATLTNLFTKPVPDDTVVMSVPARTSLLEGKEYAITYGEIKRRMASPERLSVNDLLKILKESKIPENSRNLRQKLEEQGLLQEEELYCEDFVPTGFSSLAEEEAKEMADDFVKLSTEKLPIPELACQLACYPGMSAESAEAAVEHLNFVIQMFETDGRFDENYEDQGDFGPIQRGLSRLSNASHGFAKPSFLCVYRQMRDVALEVRRILQAKEIHGQMMSPASDPQIPSASYPIGVVGNYALPRNMPIQPLTALQMNQRPIGEITGDPHIFRTC